jgi:hypothetical protein
MRDKTLDETRLERLTMGALLLVLVTALPAARPWPEALEGLTAVLLGLVLLGSAFYQRGHGWRVGRLTWAVGIAVIMLGLLSVQSGGAIHSASALAILCLGLWFMGRGLGMEV